MVDRSMQLVGQQNNIDRINSWEDLPRFLIIQGENDTGKNYLVNYLSEKFNLKYEYKTNAVSIVRELANQDYIKDRTLYHFMDFDTASIQAKNALLKIAEEPIDKMYIVITGKTQLKTLESRAKKLVMTPYLEEDVLEYVAQSDLDKERFTVDLCKKLYKAGLDTPTKIKYYSKYEHLAELVKFAEEVMDRIIYIDVDELVYIVGSFESRYEDLDVCNLFLIFLIHLIENKIKTSGYYSYYEILKVLIQYQELLNREPTLNRRMLLYQVFYTLMYKSINKF